MSRTTDLCRSRSRSAAATMLSPSTSPQEVTGLFVVSTGVLLKVEAISPSPAVTGEPQPAKARAAITAQRVKR